MFKYFLRAFICLLFFSCSKEEEYQNSPPSQFQLEDLSFEGSKLNLTWSKSEDADEDKIVYYVYINSELIKGPITTNQLSTKLEYDRDYKGIIMATDKKGATRELKFDFKSPTSKIILLRDFQSSQIVAIDINTRTRLWTRRTADNIICVKNGLVFSGFQNVIAYKLLSGEKVWEAQPIENKYYQGYRFLMADDQYLFSEGPDAMMVCIDLERHERQWKRSIFEGLHRYSMDRNNLYIPKRNNEDLLCLDKATGERKWGFQLDHAIESLVPRIEHPPLIHEENLYFHDNNGRFYSVNKFTGVKKYSIFLNKYSKTAPVWWDGNVIYTASDEIFAMKAETGEIKWKYSLGDFSFSSPYIYDGKIYVAAGKSLFCFKAQTGQLQWRTYLGADLRSSPIVYDQKLYICSNGARLNCFDANSGELEWNMGNIDFSVSSPTLVIGNNQEIIYPSNYGLQN